LFLVDNKNRDLPSTVTIGEFLKRLGQEVKYCPEGQESDLIKSYKPEVIILPKPHYVHLKLVEYKLKGIRIVCIDTEGNHQDLEPLVIKQYIFPDLYIFWNSRFYDSYLEHFKENLGFINQKIPKLLVLGCMRLDSHHKTFSEMLEDENKVKFRHKIANNKRVISFSVVTPDADFSDDEIAFHENEQKKRITKNFQYRKEVENQRILRKKTLRLLWLLKNETDEIVFLIKPHPNENVIFWQNFIKELNDDRFRLFLGEPINNLLTISDLHIAHNVCTTTFESMLRGIPTIEIHTELSQELYKEEDLELPYFSSKKPSEILSLIKQLKFNDKEHSEELIKEATRFSENFYGKFDGLICYRYAQEISKFHESEPSMKLLNYFSLSMLWLYINLRNQFLDFKSNFTNQSKNSSEKMNNFKPKSKDNELIDFRGRYDKNISQSDVALLKEKLKPIIEKLSSV